MKTASRTGTFGERILRQLGQLGTTLERGTRRTTPFGGKDKNGMWEGSERQTGQTRTRMRGSGGGRGAARMARMRLRGCECLKGDGIYIEKHENRFADMESCRRAGGPPATGNGKASEKPMFSIPFSSGKTPLASFPLPESH